VSPANRINPENDPYNRNLQMTNYRRVQQPGATWFFTVNLAERRQTRLLVEEIDLLRSAFRKVRASHPFHVDAIVVLPDHLHCIWPLPSDDTDFSIRWRLIKGRFSRDIKRGESLSPSRRQRSERGIWQRRFWDHMIRDDDDFERHMDYVHWNPVKHGWVRRVVDWPHSSFRSYVRKGVYPADWGGEAPAEIEAGECQD
jgi:putative transposase